MRAGSVRATRMSGSISNGASPIAGMLATGRGHLRKRCHELELVAQVPGDEEVLADVLASGRGHPLSESGVAQQVEAARGAFLGTRDEVTRNAVLDLDDDAADLPGDDGDAFPERFRDNEADSFAERLLDHDLGGALERVHLAVLHTVEIREEEDVLVAPRMRLRSVEVLLAFRIVVGERTDHDELDAGHLFL